jgi:hypothetical protein
LLVSFQGSICTVRFLCSDQASGKELTASRGLCGVHTHA